MTYLASVIGKTPNSIRFTAAEYDVFYPMHSGEAVGARINALPADNTTQGAIRHMYLAALTLDRVLFHMRQVDALIGSANASNSAEVITLLQTQLPEPDWVPVGMKTGGPKDIAKAAKRPLLFSVKGKKALAGTAFFYLCSFVLTHALLCLSQGKSLSDPLLRESNWGDGQAAGTPCVDHLVGAEGGAVNVAPAVGVANIRRTYGGFGGILANEVGDDWHYQTIDSPALQGVVAAGVTGGPRPDAIAGNANLANALKASGGLVKLFSMFNKLMKHYETMLSLNTGSMSLHGNNFITNLGKGVNYGAALQCGRGMMPLYIGRDGVAIDDTRKAVFRVGNREWVNQGVVDLEQSGCVPAVGVMGASARRRRVRRSRATMRMMPVRADQMAIAYARRRARPAGTRRRRDSRGRFKAMTINPAFYSARRRRPSRSRQPSRLRARLAPWSSWASSVNPMGADTEIDYKVLAAGGAVDAPPPPPAPSSTATAAAKARRRRRVAATTLSARRRVVGAPLSARRRSSRRRSASPRRRRRTVRRASPLALLSARRRRRPRARASSVSFRSRSSLPFASMAALRINEAFAARRRRRRRRSSPTRF